VVWELIPSNDELNLKTKALSAIVNLKTGAVSFWNINGEKIIEEKPIDGRRFKNAIFDGQRYYNLTQTFQASSDDAWYGLGQHQDGIYELPRAASLVLSKQYGSSDTFLISSKHYGILWDNYSLTKAGDIRPLQPLSALQLYSKKGKQGGLRLLMQTISKIFRI
jgi:alpha-D-xyloside xylohydrolase